MLIERDEIKNLVDKIHADGKTVVCTNGCFDILHVGHVRYLQKQNHLPITVLYC